MKNLLNKIIGRSEDGGTPIVDSEDLIYVLSFIVFLASIMIISLFPTLI